MHNYHNFLYEFILKIRNKISTRKTTSYGIGNSIEASKGSATDKVRLISLRDEMAELVNVLACYFDSISPTMIPAVDVVAIERLADQLKISIKDLCRKAKAAHAALPSKVYSFDGTEQLGIYVMCEAPPWKCFASNNTDTNSMITGEEAGYYDWLTRFYKGAGRVVELGPWLGSSTIAIQTGLRKNPRFVNEKLQVFDDFIWRKSWMDSYVKPEDRLPNHANFRHLFERYTSPIANDLEVHQSRFAVYDGNDAVPPLQWDSGDIEMIFVDCGRTIEANEGWYGSLSRHFIPGVTLVVMQDWRLHRELPRKWYNQTDIFTESKGDQLQLIHEVSESGIATFLYNGTKF
jgi:hypothetical protein